MIFEQIVKELHSAYNFEKKNGNFSYNDIPVYILSAEFGREYSFYQTELLADDLQRENILSEKYNFSVWLELKNNNMLSDFNGNELQNLNQWYQHILLSEHKSNGLFMLYIPNNSDTQNKTNIIEIANQIQKINGQVIFVVISCKRTADILSDNIDYSFCIDCHKGDNIEQIYCDIWNFLSQKEKDMINSYSDILTADKAVKLLKWKMKANNYLNNTVSIQKVVDEISNKSKRNSTGIGFTP